MRTITYIFVLLFCAVAANALESHFVFKNLSNKDGLSHNSIRDIVQEESGILWIATKQGLNKYDSYRIKCYYEEDSVGIPSNFTTCLYITKSNRLFVGTKKGLTEYNRQLDNFSPVLFEGKALPAVSTIIETQSGSIFIGTQLGIYVYRPTQNTVQFALPQNEITSIIEYNDDKLLATSFSGVHLLNQEGILLEKYDTSNTKGLPTNTINKAFADKAGNCWIAAANFGLLRFNLKQRECEKIKLSKNDLWETKTVHDIREDLDGNLWICSNKGVSVFMPAAKQCKNIRQAANNPDKDLNTGATYCLFRSKEDIMWMGTEFGGVDYTRLSNSKGIFNIYPGNEKNELPLKTIFNLYKDSKGILWIAAKDGGVCTMNPKTKEILTFYPYGGKNSLSPGSVHTISEDRDGNLWFGHYKSGIDILNPTTGKFKRLSVSSEINDSITENSVYSIFKDSQQQIWVGTRLGVYRYSYEKQILEPFLTKELGNAFIYKIFEDNTGKIWFCIRLGGGLACYNANTGTLKRYDLQDGLSTRKIIASTEDSSGQIWFGTIDGGVNIFNPKTDSFNQLDMNDGLPNNTVYGILEANDGNIWLSTNQGISKYNVQNGTFRNYNLDDGLAQIQFSYGSYLKDDDGTLYFGHINGLSYFNPAELSVNNIKPYLVFTDFKLANESVKLTKNGILTRPINQTERITLNYSQKAFTIDFAAVNHLSGGVNNFYYYLDGFEDSWMKVGNKTSATYTNLKPGTYTFYLKAENNDRVESTNIKRLEITIRAPFYLSIWAYLFYLSVLLAVVYYLYRKVTIYKEKAALERERLEAERLKALNQLADFGAIMECNFQDNDKAFIEKVTTIIKENIESKTLNTDVLAKELGISKTLLYQKLKKLVNMSGSDLIQSIRLKRSIELMADTNRNISDIAYEVGFSDPNYFGKVFNKLYKKSPSAFRKEMLAKAKHSEEKSGS